jgi:peptide/nickel transport system permease protein
LGIIVVVVGVAAAAPLLVLRNPIRTDLNQRLEPPGPGRPLGTDDLGRDIYSRILVGSRVSLEVGIFVLVFAVAIGTVVGALAGYLGGWADEAMMRVTDMFLAFPALVLAMAVAAALGRGLTNAMIAITFVWWPWYARLVRSQVLMLKDREFVLASKAIGASNRRVLFRHILTNCWPQVIVQASLDVGYAILVTASLGFIGLGAEPPTPEWGSMVAQGRNFLLTHWWYPTIPGLAIMITVLGFNLLGDGLRDALDPRSGRSVHV